MKSRFPFPPSVLSGALLLTALAGCGGGSSSSRPNTSSATNLIVFVSTRDGAPELYRMNPDGTQQTRITTGIRDADNPCQTRDGRIVFQSNRDGNAEIYRVNADGSNLVRLTSDAADATVSDSQPVFSPDGNTIAWTSQRGGSNNIWLMDSSGANQRQFTNDARRSDNPAWTSDSARLGYFFTPPSTDPADANGRGLEVKNVSSGQVTFTAPNVSSLSPNHLRFNNDATRAVYATVQFRSAPPQLQIYDLNTKTAGPAPSTGAGDRAPDFSPDGRSIVFDARDPASSSTNGATVQILRANADGTAIKALTTQGSNYSPDF